MLKELLGGTIKEMMEAEMDEHLGYGKSERYNSDDCRNGYNPKILNSRYGQVGIEFPQDCKSTFESQSIKNVKEIFQIKIGRPMQPLRLAFCPCKYQFISIKLKLWYGLYLSLVDNYRL